MSKSYKVIHILNSLQVGGAESLLTQYLIEVKKRTSGILDVAVLYPNNPYARMLKGFGIDVIEMNIKKKYGLSVVWKIVKLLKERKYNIVFAQLFPTSLYVSLASLFLPKTIFILRETSIHTRRRRYCILKLLDWFIYSRYTRIICVNRKVEERLIRWIPQAKKRTIVVDKGISIPSSKKTQPKKYDTIFVGRLVPAKGVDILLESLAKLKSSETITKAIIVGDGPLKDSLIKKANKLHITHIVTFLGERSDTTELLRMSRLFVLPSKWEGTPSALLEAMAVELPVVATAVGGVPEVIVNGVDGMLVPPRNPELLANAMEKVLTDQQLANRLGKRARQKIEKNYSIEKYANRILEIFEELVASY